MMAAAVVNLLSESCSCIFRKASCLLFLIITEGTRVHIQVWRPLLQRVTQHSSELSTAKQTSRVCEVWDLRSIRFTDREGGKYMVYTAQHSGQLQNNSELNFVKKLKDVVQQRQSVSSINCFVGL